MNLSEQRIGEIYLAGNVILWSFAAILMTILSDLATGLVITFWVNLVATIFLALWISFRRQWNFLKKVKQWIVPLLLVALFLGIMAYILLFTAAKYTSTTNIGILNLSQILFGFIILGALKYETFTREALIGAVLMTIGSFLVIWNQESFQFNIGDIMVLGANVCFTLGNIFQRRVRKYVGSVSILFVRSLITCLFLGVILSFTNEMSMDYPPDFWWLIIIMGIGIFCIEKMCWIETIHRMPINRASSLSAINPGLTMLWVFLFWGIAPTIFQWGGFCIMVLGAWFILLKKNIFVVLRH